MTRLNIGVMFESYFTFEAICNIKTWSKLKHPFSSEIYDKHLIDSLRVLLLQQIYLCVFGLYVSICRYVYIDSHMHTCEFFSSHILSGKGKRKTPSDCITGILELLVQKIDYKDN